MREKLDKRELLGLGLADIGPTRGTMDREDDLPTKFRAEEEGAINEEDTEEDDDCDCDTTSTDEDDTDDDDDKEEDSGECKAASAANGSARSVVSSVVDRFGFIHGGGQPEDAEEAGEDGEAATEAAAVCRRREAKWLHMLRNWESFMLKDYKKVRERCRKGIPASVRAAAWTHLCGAHYHLMVPENKTQFKRLYNQRGNQKWLEDIEKDLHRNFPTHELFGGAYERIGQAELYRVLKAYSVLNPVDGYCQAMAPIAALLLINMPAEQAFWCLVAVCDKYIPGYYSPGMEAIQLDGAILFGLLKKTSPAIYKHLKKQGIDPLMWMTEWLLCAFARTLPWPSVLRVWDMFMCEGVKVLFRVAVVLIRCTLDKDTRKSCPTMFETLEALKNLRPEITQEDFLVDQVLRLNVTEDDMEREHKRQLKKRKKAAKAKVKEKQKRKPKG